MNTLYVVLGIQAILRAAKTATDIYQEHARDRHVLLPLPELPIFDSPRVKLREFITENPDIAMSDPVLKGVWNFEHLHIKGSWDQIHLAYAKMLEYQIIDAAGPDDFGQQADAERLAAGFMVEQWCKDRKPPNAMARMAITFVDIGLEFVKTDPSLFGIGGRGEKLVVGFAANLDALIPDPDDEAAVKAFARREKFADRVLGIFLRSGLGIIAANTSTVVEDEHIARLVQGVIKPIVDALPQDAIADQINYRNLVDVFAGPSAEAAFRILSEDTQGYLGENFANDKALGVLTSEMFVQLRQITHNGSVEDVFTEKAALKLYQAGLTIVKEHPQLFVRDDGTAETKLFQALLVGTAQTLVQYPRFKGPVGAALMAMAVEVVGKNAPMLLRLDPDEPWENVARKAIEQVARELNRALEQGSLKGALTLFSDKQLIELSRIILTQASQTPGMLGVHRSEVEVIVAGMAQAMAADDNLLLSADEWIEIARVVTRLAAANPGRLFGLSADDEALAIEVIKAILRVAGQIWTAGDRSKKTLLFGRTLVDVLDAVLKALAGNIKADLDIPAIVDQFLTKLIALVAEHPNKFGSENLLKVIRSCIGKVLSLGKLPDKEEILGLIT